MIPAAPHLLHIFSTFNLGGPQMRAVQLMNAWGNSFAHSIVSVGHDELTARDHLNKSLTVDFPTFPDMKAGVLPKRLWAIRNAVAELKPDLVLTYNWGAVEAVMSTRLFGGAPLIHHEDGFGPEESDGQLPHRVLFRRFALPAARRLIVPSRILERTASEVWRQSVGRLTYIPNGVDLAAFGERAISTDIPGFEKQDDVLLVGTVAGLREEKNLTRLVRVFAHAARDINARLIIVGEGPQRAAILAEADAQGVRARVHLPGFLAKPERYVGLLDVFALSSDTEQFPISLVEAMAARLPAVCTAVGDIADIVAPENRPFIAPKDDEVALATAMRSLLLDPDLRRKIAAANRARAEREFSLSSMIDHYERTYRNALKGR